MKKLVLCTYIALIAMAAFAAPKSNEESIIGEWKGAYIINANVIPINVYISNTNSKLSAVVDYPAQNRFDIDFDILMNGDSFMLKRTTKRGDTMQYQGQLDGNVITGSFTYIGADMKENPGIFQLMKSSSKHFKGNQIPNYSLTTFESKAIDKNTFKGKYVLLDFWATWCVPCVKKRPKLEAMHKKFGDKIEIISISLDREKETVENFRKSKYPMEWHNAIRPDMKNDLLIKEFVPQGLPYGYIIDPNGKILATGDALKAENLERTANHILSE